MAYWDDYTKQELEFYPIKNLAGPLNLDRQAWDFSRGAKTQRLYIHNISGITYIKVEYTYTMSPDNREIEAYSEIITFFNEDGSVFHSIDVPVSLNIKNIKEVNRAIRQGRVDYLEAGAEQLSDGADDLDALALISEEPDKSYYTSLANDYRQLSQSLDTIFSHYDTEIRLYVERGTMDFEDAVNNETDQTILDLLALTVRQPDALFPNGLTAKESIIHQLTGVIP